MHYSIESLYRSFIRMMPESIKSNIRAPVSDFVQLTTHGLDKKFLLVDIEITQFCNLTRAGTCSAYCPNPKYGGRGGAFMSEATFRKVMDELAEDHYDSQINFAGYGEPLTDKRLPEFAAYAKQANPAARIAILTNGTLLTPELLARLAPSIDYLEITQHTKRIPAHLKAALGIKRLQNYHGGWINVDGKIIQIEYRSINSIPLTNRGGSVRLESANRLDLRKGCVYAPYTLIITAHGNVILCCNDYHSEYIFGNVNEEPLMQIWMHDDFRKVRRDVRKGNWQEYPICQACINVQERETMLK